MTQFRKLFALRPSALNSLHVALHFHNGWRRVHVHALKHMLHVAPPRVLSLVHRRSVPRDRPWRGVRHVALPVLVSTWGCM